ncbi:MAG: SigE family RNA polymerase sigma factor [Propionibacterium sp.]|nr:SigE family RNA polymerase sigma factor [Propionibacterium sp.]
MDESEFDAFYRASFAKLVGQIHAMCGNRAEAQDAVQEAFVRAWDHRRKLDVDLGPEAWVRTTAYRLAVSNWRKLRRGRREPDRALETRPATEPSADLLIINAALAKLPEPQRRAIVLHHLCDMSVDDVARETGAPTGTVKARLSRGREALARILHSEKEYRHA